MCGGLAQAEEQEGAGRCGGSCSPSWAHRRVVLTWTSVRVRAQVAKVLLDGGLDLLLLPTGGLHGLLHVLDSLLALLLVLQQGQGEGGQEGVHNMGEWLYLVWAVSCSGAVWSTDTTKKTGKEAKCMSVCVRASVWGCGGERVRPPMQLQGVHKPWSRRPQRAAFTHTHTHTHTHDTNHTHSHSGTIFRTTMMVSFCCATHTLTHHQHAPQRGWERQQAEAVEGIQRGVEALEELPPQQQEGAGEEGRSHPTANTRQRTRKDTHLTTHKRTVRKGKGEVREHGKGQPQRTPAARKLMGWAHGAAVMMVMRMTLLSNATCQRIPRCLWKEKITVKMEGVWKRNQDGPIHAEDCELA